MKKLLLPIFVFIAFTARAQHEVPKKAMAYYEEAQQQLKLRNYATAQDLLENAIQEDPQFEDAYSVLGGWYHLRHQYAQAVDVYKRLTDRMPQLKKNYAYLYASSLCYSGSIAEAKNWISLYSNGSKEWTKLNSQATMAAREMAFGGSSVVRNMGPRVNTGYAEMFPSLSADSSLLFYTRNTRGVDQDFYYATLDSCGDWFAGKPFPYPINTLQQEAAQMVSADRHYLFFMRCDNRSLHGWDMGGCDLFMSYTADTTWSTPQSFGATINTPGYEGMPCLSSDNRTLYFVSNKPGGYGGLDIWFSHFDGGVWQDPVNLGPDINTAGDEMAPFLYPDNQTLFFSSNGWPGLGGSDIYMSKRVHDSSWSQPKHLSYPINTGYNETCFNLTANGRQMFFASDRYKVDGDYDIYEGKLESDLAPQVMSYMHCYVYDSLSKLPLNYASCIVYNEAGKKMYRYTSNKGDGSFMVAMPMGVTWTVETDRVGYKDQIDTIAVDTAHAGKHDTLNIAMLPSGYLEPIKDTNVLTVYFALNKLKIDDSASNAISRIMAPWLDVRMLQITINGYTDNSGTPIINEEYSYQRSSLVRDVLLELGFPYEQMEVKGWGDANPVTDNDTKEHRDLNRRVEVSIRR